MMTHARMAKIRVLAKNDLLLEELLADYDRLRATNKNTRELVRALRGMVVAAHEAGEIFVHVELGEGGKLVLRAADRYLSGDEPACDGCGAIPTSTHDANGNHLCRDCGLTLMEGVL
jgi:hypothetical protein